MAITTSYGRIAKVNGSPTPYMYGAGYGSNNELSMWADKAAEILSTFGLDVEKRGNTYGLSVGAHWDGENGECIGLSAFRTGKTHKSTARFHASFWADVSDAARILAEVPNRGGYNLDADSRAYRERIGQPVKYISVYGPATDTLQESWDWLRTWGGKFCPTMKRG